MTYNTISARAFTTIAAVVAWAAVVLQFVLSTQLAMSNGKSFAEGVFIYFGFFTVLTNILVALALSCPLVGPASSIGRFFACPVVATTVAAGITVVGVAYFFLLRNVWDPQGWQLVADVMLHYITPLLFLAYWWLVVPKERLAWSDILKCMLYPFGYIVYAFVRGAISGLYPYHFIDVTTLGYGVAIANACGVLLGFVAVAVVLVWVARIKRNKS